YIFDPVRGDGIVEMRALGHDVIMTALALQKIGHRARENGIRHDAMPPADDVPVRVEPDLDELRLQRPELVVPDIVLAAPYDLDRTSFHLPGERDRIDDEVGLGFAPEAAAKQECVHFDLLGRRADYLRGKPLRAGR